MKSAKALSHEVDELKKAIAALEEDLRSARETNQRLLTQIEEVGRVASQSTEIQMHLEVENANLREQVTILRGEKEELTKSSKHIEETARFHANQNVKLEEDLQTTFTLSVVLSTMILTSPKADSLVETSIAILDVAKQIGYSPERISTQLGEALKVAVIKAMSSISLIALNGVNKLPYLEMSIRRREETIKYLQERIVQDAEVLQRITERIELARTESRT